MSNTVTDEQAAREYAENKYPIRFEIFDTGFRMDTNKGARDVVQSSFLAGIQHERTKDRWIKGNPAKSGMYETLERYKDNSGWIRDFHWFTNGRWRDRDDDIASQPDIEYYRWPTEDTPPLPEKPKQQRYE